MNQRRFWLKNIWEYLSQYERFFFKKNQATITAITIVDGALAPKGRLSDVWDEVVLMIYIIGYVGAKHRGSGCEYGTFTMRSWRLGPTLV